MNTALKSITHTLIIGLGLASTSAALADPHWDNGWHRGWDHRDRDDDHDDHYRRDYRERFNDFDYARVIDVDPIVRRVEVASPQRDCWYEDRAVYGQPRSHTPAVLGAIIGGVIGHQFGSGHSRNLGTVAGAVLGASVGRDSAMRDGDVETRSEQRCEVRTQRNWEDRIDGYRVTYVYRGRQYCTNMPYNPGSRVQVRVGVDVDVVR